MDKPYPLFAIDLFCCNPACPKGKKRFQSERAVTMHLNKNPTCRYFLEQKHLKATVHVHQTSARLTGNIEHHVVAKSNPQMRLRRNYVNQEYSGNIIDAGIPFANATTNATQNELDVDCHSDGCKANSEVLLNLPSHATSQAPNPITFSPSLDVSSNFPFSTDQKWTISLLKVLNDMNAPDYAFASILTWARSAVAEQYSFYPKGGLSRNRNLAYFTEGLQNGKLLLPAVVRVPSPNNPDLTCDVIAFDFVPQLLRLLQNPQITNSNTLLIDVNDPMRRYDSGGVVGEAISGSVYNEAYDRLITDPAKQLFVPIIQWIDRTSVSGNERFSLKPYMFTPAIYKCAFRNTIQAWGYHGYLPKPKVSSAQNAVQKQGDNIRNYHAQLQTVLETFRSSNSRLTNVCLPLGPNGTIVVDVVTCILFVIQDMQEGDQLCGRYGPHAPRIQRQCRACDISYEDLDNPQIRCNSLYALPMHIIATETSDEHRTRWSQHRLDNVFNHVLLADPLRGILGSTPVETMHAFRKGVIEMVTFLVLENVPASKKAALDRLAIDFHTRHRQTYRRVFPSTDFSNGVTNLTKISAAERLGLVFLFVILSQYDEGWQILESTLNTALAPVLQVFEALLCFDAWLSKPTFWNKSNELEAKRIAQASIRQLLDMCCHSIPTRNTNPWKFPKFHELLHIVDDICRFGAPQNYSAQRPESLLIAAAKQPGRRAQKRHLGSTFEMQSAQRLADTVMIDVLHNAMFPKWENMNVSTMDNVSLSPDIVHQGTGHGTFARIERQHHTQIGLGMESNYNVTWKTSSNVSNMNLDLELLNYICSEFGDNVKICTEFVRDAFTFRCHPSFQSNGSPY